MLDHAHVRTMLPHGPPMLLVDRVEWLEPGRSLRAIKAISGSEPCYQQLPDGLPAPRYAYPATLVLESFAQAVALLWHTRAGSLAGAGRVLMLAGARECRFDGAAYPGDVLRHQVALERVIADTAFAAGETWVAGRRIATIGSLLAVVRPLGTLDHPTTPT